jgi:hypothetical protein
VGLFASGIAHSVTTIAAPPLADPGVTTAGRCRPVAARGRGLDRILRTGPFRIRYTTTGRDGVANASVNADANRNGVPDSIEDLSRQLDIANRYYVDVLGLTPPLSQPRYQKARGIDILVQAMDHENGMSYDEVIQEKGQDECRLMIVVNSKMGLDGNPTAAHELFHLFQYGYAMFKVPWYLEGMARWIEGVFRPSIYTKEAVDKSIRCKDILEKSYAASAFWNAVAAKSMKKAVAVPTDLVDAHYVSGRPVIANRDFPGGIVRPVLKSLQLASSKASRGDLLLYDWPESVQRSHQFDAAMCSAIERALGQGG